MKDRIRQLIEAQHMTQQTFADFTGINAATVSGILKDRTKPTLKVVEAIRANFPNINIDWLMFGNGTMFLDDKNENTPSSTLREQTVGEQSLNFGDIDTPSPQQNVVYGDTDNRLLSNTRIVRQNMQPIRTDVVREKDSRKITEIRVFYDDQTWESFVPKK